MAFGVKRWTARHLLAAWSVYWVALLAVGGGLVMRIVRFASNAPKGHADVSAALDGGMISVRATLDGHEVMGGSISMLFLALLIALPPLVLWVYWLLRRPHPEAPADERRPLLPAQRWTNTSHHEELRREELRERKD